MLCDSVRFFLIFVLSPRASAMSRIFVLDLGGGSLVTNTSCGSRGGAQRGPAPTPLFLDQNEARIAEKNLESGPPSYLRVWMTAPPYEGLGPPLLILSKKRSVLMSFSAVFVQMSW